MLIGVIICFVLGYLLIVLEHPLKLDKTVPALLMAAICWALIAFGNLEVFEFHDDQLVTGDIEGILLHHLGKTAEILVFLIGAMTIVEIIDLHMGFEILKGWVDTKSKKRLLWVISILAFILSAIIDNLTATIVLITLLRKLVHTREERLWYAGMIVIAANAGGAWSPIGDVTTTMLWIGHKVTTLGLVTHLVIPAIVCMAVPTFIASRMKAFQGDITIKEVAGSEKTNLLSSKTMLFLGLGAIVFVPIFKTVTHLPPYMGMMLGLGVVWLVSEYIHPEEDFSNERRHLYSAHKALSRIEMSSILFFLGILMAVGALESLGTLINMAQRLDAAVPNQDVVVLLLGVGSAIIDNVPLVAASMGMYTSPVDSKLWQFIAYAAGTGGSMLIIGSAAGVAAMGMERIDFIWYFKNISLLAVIGFLAGAGAFLVIYPFL
jgi:Na+/H+ antiporter NhaD/arsenite permease-like protein